MNLLEYHGIYQLITIVIILNLSTDNFDVNNSGTSTMRKFLLMKSIKTID